MLQARPDNGHAGAALKAPEPHQVEVPGLAEAWMGVTVAQGAVQLSAGGAVSSFVTARANDTAGADANVLAGAQSAGATDMPITQYIDAVKHQCCISDMTTWEMGYLHCDGARMVNHREHGNVGRVVLPPLVASRPQQSVRGAVWQAVHMAVVGGGILGIPLCAAQSYNRVS